MRYRYTAEALMPMHTDGQHRSNHNALSSVLCRVFTAARRVDTTCCAVSTWCAGTNRVVSSSDHHDRSIVCSSGKAFVTCNRVAK